MLFAFSYFIYSTNGALFKLNFLLVFLMHFWLTYLFSILFFARRCYVHISFKPFVCFIYIFFKLFPQSLNKNSLYLKKEEKNHVFHIQYRLISKEIRLFFIYYFKTFHFLWADVFKIIDPILKAIFVPCNHLLFVTLT